MRQILKNGLTTRSIGWMSGSPRKHDEIRSVNLAAMRAALEAVLILASRYAELAGKLAETASGKRKEHLLYLAETPRQDSRERGLRSV
jgi:hypothetical protein